MCSTVEMTLINDLEVGMNKVGIVDSECSYGYVLRQGCHILRKPLVFVLDGQGRT